MEEKGKDEVIALRKAGKSYREISAQTGLSLGTVKTIVRRFCDRRCSHCGKPLTGKQGRFCSDACRYKWWRSHRSYPERECPVCGKRFSPRDPRRRFCSPACYHRAAAKGGGEDE